MFCLMELYTISMDTESERDHFSKPISQKFHLHFIIQSGFSCIVFFHLNFSDIFISEREIGREV